LKNKKLETVEGKNMNKITNSFITNKQVLFIGVAKKYKAFCNMVYNALTRNGIKVFPVKIDDAAYNFSTYDSIDDIPALPETAYTILDTPDNKKIIQVLKKRGVKKILFHSKNIIDDELISICKNLGLEVAVSCPLMLYGKGLHRLHGFFSGIKK
jgi:predicted CoA-binding protein